jgi:hypothetical protein
MKLLEQWAEENDYQAWIERVADDPKGHEFFIEDGALFIKEDAADGQ